MAVGYVEEERAPCGLAGEMLCTTRWREFCFGQLFKVLWRCPFRWTGSVLVPIYIHFPLPHQIICPGLLVNEEASLIYLVPMTQVRN